jgi:hypothetical protein
MSAKKVWLVTAASLSIGACASDDPGFIIRGSEALTGGLPGCPAAAPGAYSFRAINVPGAGGTYAQGINADGVTVGATDAGFGWVRAGGRVTKYPGEVNAINDRGDLVGDDGNGGYIVVAGQQTYVLCDGAVFTLPTQINAAGQVVGLNVMDDHWEGFIATLDADGQLACTAVVGPGAQPGDDPSLGGTVLLGNNERGQAVGAYSAADGKHGFLYSEGAIHEVAVPGASYTQPSDIDDSGAILGHYQLDPSQLAYQFGHGFVIRDQACTTLDFPGARSTRLFAWSSRGRIVGSYDDRDGRSHGFEATPR